MSWCKSGKSQVFPCWAEAKIYATDINPFLSAACQLADQSFQVCRCTDPDYTSQILELCLTYGIKLIIPMIDTELQVFADTRGF